RVGPQRRRRNGRGRRAVPGPGPLRQWPPGVSSSESLPPAPRRDADAPGQVQGSRPDLPGPRGEGVQADELDRGSHRARKLPAPCPDPPDQPPELRISRLTMYEPLSSIQERHRANRGERGAALVIAILVLAILTVIGIALMMITSTESRIAANEWSIN